MSTKGPERVNEMVGLLREWQGIERKAMEQTAEIIEKTDNAYLRLIMEIIRHDSLMHHRVQGFIIDTMTTGNVALSHDELAAIWDSIQAHDETEKNVIKIAEELREKAWTPLHKHLLEYLLTDEKKHDHLLEQLEQVKRDMSRSTQ